MTYIKSDPEFDQMWVALADPTRRAVFQLATGKGKSVQAIADQLPVSRPAVSQHLKVLHDAKLVSVALKGRQRFYRAQPAGLASLRRWLDEYWSEALENFAVAADEEEENKND